VKSLQTVLGADPDKLRSVSGDFRRVQIN